MKSRRVSRSPKHIAEQFELPFEKRPNPEYVTPPAQVCGWGFSADSGWYELFFDGNEVVRRPLSGPSSATGQPQETDPS